MDLITEHIVIGTHVEARDIGLLRKFGVRSVICLDGDVAPGDERALGVDAVEVFRLIDGPGNRPDVFVNILSVIDHYSKHSPRLLVHCRAGRSRSVIAVAGHLVRTQHMTAEQALAFIRDRREVWITPGIEKLLDYCRPDEKS